MPVAIRYSSAGLSDPGRKRGNNEDRFLIDAERGVYLVVDGVGGQNAGEKAAETAVNLIRERLARPMGTLAERVREAIALANNEVYRLAQSRPDWQGMACVLTVAVLEDGRATLGHVGDSRAYLLRGGEIRKITNDHSPVGEREDRGEIGEAEAMRHPRRNEVFRDVGSEPHTPDDPAFIDLTEVEVPPDAALLLCSDGLSDLVPSQTLLETIESHAGDPRGAVRALIAAANAAGGKDNVTAIVVEGPRFAATVLPRLAPAPTQPEPAHWILRVFFSRTACLLYGLLLAAALFLVFKPHLVEDKSGTALGAGPVRHPVRWTVGPGAHDFPNLTMALERAIDGDSILVAPGRYASPVKLKNGVELVSEKPREGILGGGVTAVDIRGARLCGFAIEGGVSIAGSDVELADLEISGATGPGLEFANRSESLVLGCRIVNNSGGGVVIREGSTPRLVQNLVAGNGKNAKSPRPGIEIRDTSHPVLIDNVITDNGAEGVWTNPLVPDVELTRRNFFGVVDPGRPARRVKTVVP